MFFDAHLHHKKDEIGGFLIGLEGEPFFEETYSNDEVLSLHDPQNRYFSFYYVSKNNIFNHIDHKYLKFHPRREKYGIHEIIESIRLNNPKCVIIDTLNEPFLTPYDYWKIPNEFPFLPCIFAHSGGYLINDFIKICHFQKNVWIDFALTHTTLAMLGDLEKGLPYINQAIKYSLNGPFKNRVLLSSDFPFFDQNSVVSYYSGYIELLNNNFLELVRIIK